MFKMNGLLMQNERKMNITEILGQRKSSLASLTAGKSMQQPDYNGKIDEKHLKRNLKSGGICVPRRSQQFTAAN
jgi:hypothetical protein